MKKTLANRILSIFLSLAILFGALPFTSFAASENSTSIADPKTIEQWKDLFPKTSNRYSGGVFIDKSVYTASEAVDRDSYFYDIADKLSFGEDNFENENFLVSLSAIGSNSEIIGYSATPTDTMLVLDVSGSMEGDRAEAMVESANRAVESLLALNRHNRVGVVLYSGRSTTGSSETSTGSVILPLGRYETSVTERINEGTRDEPEYVIHDVYFTISNDTVSLAATYSGNGKNRRQTGGVTKEGETTYITGSKSVVGGTYIQNGLYLAYNQFPKGNDTVISGGQIQEGTQRMPIVVLMSDGAPTTSTTSYNNVGKSNAGSGSTNDATAAVGFLTQLTASWIKENLKGKYNGTDPKFYTLGVGTQNSATATGVLNPSSVANNASGYWTDFLADNSVNLTLPDTDDDNWSTTLTAADNTVLSNDYVDEYWAASNADDMITAFEEIVQEIIIQSRYYATLVSSGNIETDGYISFTDEIGTYMEVKDMKGIHIGEGTLVTGDMFANAMFDGTFRNTETGVYTSDGAELILALKDRFGVDENEALELINTAIANKYIYYNSETDFSNYVSWYADQNNGYIAPYNALQKTVPAGAKYIVKSYIYSGDITHEIGRAHV